MTATLWHLSPLCATQLCEIEDDDLLDKLAEIFETRYAQAMEEEEE